MRAFSFWQTQIQHAHTIRDLKMVGKKIAALKDQTDFLGTETKLNEAQLVAHRGFNVELGIRETTSKPRNKK